MSFTNLIRFEDSAGRLRYGDILEANLNNIVGSEVQVLEGDPYSDCMRPTNETAVVCKVGYIDSCQGDTSNGTDPRGFQNKQVLPPVENVPIFLCIGLNYSEHAQEAGVCSILYSLFCITVNTELIYRMIAFNSTESGFVYKASR